MKKGLILGRFQPFHLGHLELIKSIIDQQIEPVICIGSAQHSYTEENPFTVEERMKMIEEVMKDFNCKYSIFGIPDINNYDLYVSHLETFVPTFDIVSENSEAPLKFDVSEIPTDLILFFLQNSFNSSILTAPSHIEN